MHSPFFFSQYLSWILKVQKGQTGQGMMGIPPWNMASVLSFCLPGPHIQHWAFTSDLSIHRASSQPSSIFCSSSSSQINLRGISFLFLNILALDHGMSHWVKTLLIPAPCSFSPLQVHLDCRELSFIMLTPITSSSCTLPGAFSRDIGTLCILWDR